MIENLYSPVEGKLHDATMLRMSSLMPIPENLHSNKKLSMIAWPKFEYWWSGYLEMSATTSNLVTLKKTQKIALSNVGRMYRISALLTNAHTSLYKNNCTNYFGLDPPTL